MNVACSEVGHVAKAQQAGRWLWDGKVLLLGFPSPLGLLYVLSRFYDCSMLPAIRYFHWQRHFAEHN